mmetsp:Transcript_1547/g.2561  ORF Transcript_1547/g.2561 Transcript_1547/m.2561 type:complete len:369 (-) Transcript_1547:2631-3737(-)
MNRLLYHLPLFILLLALLAKSLKDDLMEAVHMADVHRVRWLLDQDEDIITSRVPVVINRVDEVHGRTSLMVCGMDPQERAKDVVDQNCLRIAELLYQRGANVSFVDRNGWDVVSMGAVRGFVEFCSFLLDKGAMVDRADPQGITPIMKAAGHGHFDTFKLFFLRGANLTKGDSRGLTAVHYATVFALQNTGHVSMLKSVSSLLQRHNVSIDASVDKDNRTPLMYAAISNDLNVARVLLSAGADPRRMDNFGVPVSVMSHNEEIRHETAAAGIALTEQEHAVWLKTHRKLQRTSRIPSSNAAVADDATTSSGDDDCEKKLGPGMMTECTQSESGDHDSKKEAEQEQETKEKKEKNESIGELQQEGKADL